MNNYAFQEVLAKRYDRHLFEHSRGVEDMARRLAVSYGADEEKAALAGLLHDYGKILSHQDLLRIAADNNIADEVELQEPVLLHAPVGSWLLERDFQIDDREVLQAVATHTTGAAGMSLLARIVYLADFIEPGRSCPGAADIRELAFQDMEKALLGAVDSTINYVLGKHSIIHPNSILFRNWLIASIRNKGQELLGNETF